VGEGSMSAPPTTRQQRNARRLLRRIVGPPPVKHPGKVSLTLTLVVVVIASFATALSWEISSLFNLSVICVILSGILGTLGNLAAYHRWPGELIGDLLRIASTLGIFLGAILFTAHMAFIGRWGSFWYLVIVLTGITIVAVAWHLTRHDDGSHLEDGSRAERERHGDT
jgi:hypothetical protein